MNSAEEMFLDDVGKMFTQQFCCTLHHFVSHFPGFFADY
jgi:hypothetical protein